MLNADLSLAFLIANEGDLLEGPSATQLDCLEAPTAGPITYNIPVEAPPGDFILCAVDTYDPAACAAVTVVD